MSVILTAWCTRELELERWQIARVDAGIKAADNGIFAEDSQIKKHCNYAKIDD